MPDVRSVAVNFIWLLQVLLLSILGDDFTVCIRQAAEKPKYQKFTDTPLSLFLTSSPKAASFFLVMALEQTVIIIFNINYLFSSLDSSETQHMTVFGDRVFKEIMKLKWGH